MELAKALEKNKVPPVERTKAGHYKTGERQLEEWRRKGVDVANDILKYREVSKLKSSFVGNFIEEKEDSTPISFLSKKNKNSSYEDNIDGLAKYIKCDNRIHPSFGPARTNTMRGICNSPNLQQIPKSGEAGKRMRPVFKKPEDYYICEADYAGFQLRIAAIMSKDPNV